jgi:hypothetical protein
MICIPLDLAHQTQIEKVDEIVQKNRCLSIQAVAELANIDEESV